MAARPGLGHVSAALVLALSGLAYRDNLGNAFFGSDTWPWLVSTRLDSPSDILRVAFSPIMSGTSFVAEVALFYHPLTALSYSLDQALFGLNPFGFYATNLLIHLTAVGMLYSLARALGASWWASSVCALVLGLHPIAAATVPSLPRRQDMVVGALLLGSMSLLGRSGVAQMPIHRRTLVGAMALFFLALGGKEIAYAGLAIVPFVMGSCLLPRRRGFQAAWVLAGFTLLEAIAFGIRWRVLGGLGGYYASGTVLGSSQGMLEYFVRPYVTFVLWPVQTLLPERLRDWLIVVGLLAIVAGVAIAGFRQQRRWMAILGVVWQAAFLLLYAAVHTSLSAYLLYVPLAGLALLVAALLDGTADRLRTGIDKSLWPRLSGACAVLSATGATVLIFGVLRTSSLVTFYPEFKDASLVSHQFIDQALPCLSVATPGAVVHVSDLPHRIDYTSPESHFLDVYVFEPYSFESVVRLLAPASGARVQVDSSQDVQAIPRRVAVTCSPRGDGRQLSVQVQN